MPYQRLHSPPFQVEQLGQWCCWCPYHEPTDFLIGKLARQEFEELELLDLAPRYRLACQYLLLDEDIVVKF